MGAAPIRTAPMASAARSRRRRRPGAAGSGPSSCSCSACSPARDASRGNARGGREPPRACERERSGRVRSPGGTPMARLSLTVLAAAALLAPAAARAQPEGLPLPPPSERGRLGLQIQPMTPELREYMHAPPEAGVLVVAVEPDA